VQQKFVPLSELGAADASFGHVRPRSEVTEDIAVCAVPSVAMGKFSLEQVREWLSAVAKGTVGAEVSSGAVNQGTAAGGAVGSAASSQGSGNNGSSSAGVNGKTGGVPSTSTVSQPDYSAEAEIIYNHVAKLHAEAIEATAKTVKERRELPKSAIFGTVTKLDRMKRFSKTSAGKKRSYIVTEFEHI
jgi:type IV secretory pathway TrbL component